MKNLKITDFYIRNVLILGTLISTIVHFLNFMQVNDSALREILCEIAQR